jgi:hypothetical protein
MKMRWHRALIVAGCASVLAFDGLSAQTKAPPPSPMVSALDQCRKIADPAQRLACFDRASGTLVQATTSGAVAVVDRRQMQQARRSLFGFNMPKMPFFSGDSGSAMNRLDTTVRSVKALDNGRLQIVVAPDNAVWEITEPPVSFEEPRAGQKVTITRSSLGGYFIQVNGQVGVR